MRALILALLPGCFLVKSNNHNKCPRDRALEIGLQEDVTKFAGCEQAAGVTIRTGATIDVMPLRELEDITGDLSIGPTVGLDEASFNGLLHVGGTIRIADNGSLRGLFLPRLEQVGRIEVENNAVLASISMPRLTNVQGALVIADNAALEMISASVLSRIGKELVISGHPRLNLVELARLEAVEAIRIEANPKLPTDVIDQLVSKSATPPSQVPPPANPDKPAQSAKPADQTKPDDRSVDHATTPADKPGEKPAKPGEKPAKPTDKSD